MERRMDRGLNCVSSVRSIKVVAPLLLSAALLGWSAVAPAQSTDQNTAQSTDQNTAQSSDQNQAQATAPAAEQAPATAAPAAKTMPDAAVEANVLKALAGAPDLANQPMTTTTVYGVVTLSGSVESEALRVEAETIVSKTKGVQKVVDEMTLGGENANAQPEGNMAPAPPAAQAQAPIEEGSPDSDNTGSANQVQNQAPNQAPNQSANPAVQQPYGGPPPGYAQTQPVYGGQEGGAAVTVPAGALLRMRINQTLTSASAKAGDRFDGIVVNDVVAGGAVAIPRGAAVQGTVVDAKKSGALAGRGELTLQLTQVTLGGKSYAIVSDVWGQNTGDKAVHSVNSTAAGAVLGALVGAAAGGGQGAAIGAGVGGALGLGSAAASPNGQVYVPSEGLLTFHLAQAATVATVSQAEMDRLAQGVRVNGPQQLQRRYPPVYYGPYGPVYYRPYPYGYPYPY